MTYFRYLTLTSWSGAVLGENALTPFSAHRRVQLVAFARRREKSSEGNKTGEVLYRSQRKHRSLEGGRLRNITPDIKVTTALFRPWFVAIFLFYRLVLLAWRDLTRRWTASSSTAKIVTCISMRPPSLSTLGRAAMERLGNAHSLSSSKF